MKNPDSVSSSSRNGSRNMRRFSLLLALAAPGLLAAFDGHAISEALRKGIAAGLAPGAVVVIQQHGQIIFEEAAGFADLETSRPMRTDDIFMMASSSKPFAATAI